MSIKLAGGNNEVGVANVDATFNLQTNLPYTTPAGIEVGGGTDVA